MGRVEMVLPLAPGVNDWKTPIGKGRAILTAEARAWKEAAAQLAKKRCSFPLTGPLHVRIDVFRPTLAGDVDGPIKLALDGLQGVVYANDSEVSALVARKHKDAARPRMLVTVTEVRAPKVPSSETTLSKAEQEIFDACALEMARQKEKKRERRKAKLNAKTPVVARPVAQRVSGENLKDFVRRTAKPATYRR